MGGVQAAVQFTPLRVSPGEEYPAPNGSHSEAATDSGPRSYTGYLGGCRDSSSFSLTKLETVPTSNHSSGV